MDERDFDLKYRPKTLAEVVGQHAAVKTITAFKGKIPRAVMIHGPSGTGKTTLARIISHDILGLPDPCMDMREINCGVVESSIDMVREINAQQTSSAMFGGKRVWILDEVQTLSRQKYAQEALLKVLEECPAHVQFFLVTTDPKRLLPAVRNRCVEVSVRVLKPEEITALANRIAKAERIILTDEVRERIVALADGGARDAVKMLQKIAGVKGEDAQLETLGSGFKDGAPEFSLVKALVPWKGLPSWPAVRKVLVELDESDPEGLRCMILASARFALLKGTGNDPLLFKVIGLMAEPMSDLRSGKAILAARCFQICNTK